METDIKTWDRVAFVVPVGGQVKAVKATVVKGPYKSKEDEEILVDLDCDGWEKTLTETPLEGLVKL